MKFFPTKTYIIITELSKEKVKQALLNNLIPKKILRFKLYLSDANDRYEGKVFDKEFKCNRLDFLRYRLPIIKGTIEDGFTKTEIQLTIQYRKLDKFFFYGWLITIICLILFYTLMIQFDLLDLLITFILSLTLLLLGWLIYFLIRPSLNAEAKKAVEYFEKILNKNESR